MSENTNQPPQHGGLRAYTAEQLLLELRSRGGIFAALADAQLLVLRKSEDYNGGPPDSPSAVAARDAYFPFGATSYAHMVHVKSQRLVQLVRNEADGRPVNFEGVVDTLKDLVNYSAFFLERLSREPKP